MAKDVYQLLVFNHQNEMVGFSSGYDPNIPIGKTQTWSQSISDKTESSSITNLSSTKQRSDSHSLSLSQSASFFMKFGQIYWTNVGTPTIYVANINETSQTPFNKKLIFESNVSNSLCGIFIDTRNKKIYWNSGGAGPGSGVYVGNINIESPSAPQSISQLTSGYSIMFVDSINNKIYLGCNDWCVCVGDFNAKSPAAPTNVRLISEIGVTGAISTAFIDVVRNKVYFGTWNSAYWKDADLYVGDVDPKVPENGFSNVIPLLTNYNISIDGLSLDLSQGKIYWRRTDNTGDPAIYVANINVINPTQLTNIRTFMTSINNLAQEGGLFVLPIPT